MKKRFHKRYIVAVILFLWAMCIRFLSYFGQFDFRIFKYPEVVAERLTVFFANSWSILLAVTCLILYCCINHTKAGKVFYFIGIGVMILVEAYAGFIQPFEWLTDDVDVYANFINVLMMGILFMAVFIIMIHNGARPHLAKVIVTAYLWLDLFWLAALPNGETLLRLFGGQNLEIILPSMIGTALRFLPLALGYVLIAIFDFQSRPRRQLSVEEQLKQLKEKYEGGQINVFDYEEQRTELLRRF